MRFNWLFVMVASLGMIAFVGTARATTIHAVTVTDNGVTDPGSSDAYASDGNTGTAWYTIDYPGQPSYFAQAGAVAPVLTLDLGSDFSLTSAALLELSISWQRAEVLLVGVLHGRHEL